MLSLKLSLNLGTFDRVMSKCRRVRFFETQTVKSILLLSQFKKNNLLN